MRRVHRTSSRRSGYAFAHQEGYGELITSGKNMRLNVPQSSSSLARTMLSGSTSWIENLRKKTAENFNTFSSDKSTKLWSLDLDFFLKTLSCGHIFALFLHTKGDNLCLLKSDSSWICKVLDCKIIWQHHYAVYENNFFTRTPTFPNIAEESL